ncbi:REP-associated tyrosine transposase [Chloracidobacterium thermophilum]|uniref:Transposase IS200-like domain-containing protein n=1 Tax=Chloracidobacterium thermophilum (strain B) TaxID=981222 RepID=G2LD95_CHLTF|nr:DUF1156 domain-containing protein [Chloracidobacterium thermophilum]AEP11955.1 Protein of unknown function (DUF1568), Protein of unknown function (DUF1156) [Chloracidobacterium thermophilum B]QUV77715.1 DUF1156 domain-containing protein [Chloracidobacterium thermophilum]
MRKKLIEVALPLEAINAASAREKSIRHGHPSTLHLWWARRPLAAARAVIFAQMVDDPASVPEEFPTPEAQERERQRLFRLLEQLVQWENTTNEEVLESARREIRRSWARHCLGAAASRLSDDEIVEAINAGRMPALPGFHDPFAGGGALPLEAQRLGLEAWASDLNPVAVLINKAMIEIPPRFAGQPPVNPEARQDKQLFAREWKGAQGLAEDVRYYGQWMRAEAEKRIGHLYPKVEVTAEMAADRPDLQPLVGQKLTVIAWLWARTVKSPNPAFADVDVPLVSTFILSSKAGKEAYVEPIILASRPRLVAGETPALPGYYFTVKVGKPPEKARNGTKMGGSGSSFLCLLSGTPIGFDYARAEAMQGRMGARLMAIVAEGPNGRVYLPPTEEHEAIARSAQPTWKPETPLPEKALGFRVQLYGMKTYGDLFTPRQLVALTTFSDLVAEAMEKCREDYLGARASRPQTIWHSRGRLPHFEAGEVPQHITFRLHDSLPRELLARWQDELARLPEDEQALERRKRIEAALDAGHGACWLRDPHIAELVEQSLLHFDGERYALHAWCVMPNHVHVLVTPLHGNSLSSILHGWKSFTAREANRRLGREGPFWMEEYFDRAIRDENHFRRVVEYIGNNPVKAGLCPEPSAWRWSSAWEGGRPARHDSRAGRPRSQDAIPLRDGGTGAQAYAEAYAEAVGVYLAIGISRLANRLATICIWNQVGEKIEQVFARQAIPMTWDFAEANVFSDSTGSWAGSLEWVPTALEAFPPKGIGQVGQADASNQVISAGKIVSTDPPYYDNIGYADLSDFFYVWLRRTLKPVFPDLFATLSTPKAEELVATPYRHGSKEKAERFFLEGMTQAMRRLAEQAHPAFPVTIYYAFKQAETLGARASRPRFVAGGTPALPGVASTGWETFLDAVIRAGFAITGTWPMRTERQGRMIGNDTNALASSIVLVCRPRPKHAPTATRREFVSALKAELPPALAELQKANIAPVDLAQAAIGPGMAVYTRYAQVLDAEGQPVSVREALALINQTLDEVLTAQEGDFDADTRWAVAWFEQYGFDEREFGEAETLSKAKNTSVDGMVEAGILASRRGRVRLLKPEELPADWDPATDPRLTDWEIVHHLIRVLEREGEPGAAGLVARLGARAEIARELAYRLYTVCERRKRAAEGLSYNALVQSWPEIARLAAESRTTRPAQETLFEHTEA